ncbi:hypothetical protein CDAR_124571 [Caerostris darwini]|uniref:Uncharacterized protein n=1 Tax=Caerostris darwini TaxID=1538125 RepID=A0AAV4RMZ0_9ARAC|nr:hypothetical protein CDAR_124571 [Caerostris darwini]
MEGEKRGAASNIFFPFTPLHSPPLKQKPISTSKIQIHSSPSQFKPQQDRHSKNPLRDIVLSLCLKQNPPPFGALPPSSRSPREKDTPHKRNIHEASVDPLIYRKCENDVQNLQEPSSKAHLST